MATSIEEIKGFLDEFELRYQVHDEESAIAIAFSCEPQETTYRDADGDPCLQLVITVLERGEFLAVFAPMAWNLRDCRHKAAACEAVVAIQMRYKMLRFDYDPETGELRPNVELPLEDAEITSRLFHRLVHAMIHGVKRFAPVIQHAMRTGEVSMALVDDGTPSDDPGPDLARLAELAEEAGGIDALEALLGGCASDDDDCEGKGGDDEPGRRAG
ncbi:MAG: hypothetical protein EBX36_00110 [Planctomycetia bacterium]|nr:hypothetical protein [Planctomycetia bacterium]